MNKRLRASLAVGFAALLLQLYGYLAAQRWSRQKGMDSATVDALVLTISIALLFALVAFAGVWITLRMRRAEPRAASILFVVALAVFFVVRRAAMALTIFLWDAKIGMLWERDSLTAAWIVTSTALIAIASIVLSIIFSVSSSPNPPPNTSLERTREG
jgi:hypothetical protein